MKNIIKNFVEIYELDMEGRRGEWKPTDMTHDEAVAKMNPWLDKVRTVEKTFNPETFTITEKIVRLTEKDFEGGWTWAGKTKETV